MLHKVTILISQFFSETVSLSSPHTAISRSRLLRWCPVTVVSPEIAALLDGLSARDELEELARLFEESSQAWPQISEPERKILIARAAALMANRKD